MPGTAIPARSERDFFRRDMPLYELAVNNSRMA